MRLTLEYADGYYIAKDGVGVINFVEPENREFAEFVLKTLNAAKQIVQRTCATCGASTYAHGVVIHGKEFCTNCGASS